jgi:MFS family permease
MSKKFVIISLIITAIIGSLITFYTSNLLFSDIGQGFSGVTIFITLTGLMLGAIIVAIPLYIIRLYKRENNKKALCKLYLIITMVLSAFGFVFAILAGLVDLHSFIKPYPFTGYVIIMLVLHLLILGCSIFLFFKYVKAMPEDNEKFKMSAKHVFHTIGLYLLIALAFNRFGAFLLMPVYAQFSTLYKTFIYYLFLLIPMALLVIKTLRILEIGKNLFIPSLVVALINLALMIAILLVGKSDSAFISAVSAAAPLERLGSMPMEILIHFFAYLGVSIYYVIVSKIKKN